jgi:hypothetical protein
VSVVWGNPSSTFSRLGFTVSIFMRFENVAFPTFTSASQFPVGASDAVFTGMNKIRSD